MKTKYFILPSALLALALAGLGEQASWAIVGYVNVSVTPGWTFIANPLQAIDDSINTVIPAAPDGAIVTLWDVTAQTYQPFSAYQAGIGWDTDINLPVGLGFAFYSPSNSLITFVGMILQGSLTNFVPGINKFSMLGSMVPEAGPITGTLGFPLIDGANAHLFNTPGQVFFDADTCFQGYGWFDPSGGAGTNGPSIAVAQAFFVQNPGQDTNWVVNFSVASRPVPLGSRELPIQRIQVRNGRVTLAIPNPGGGACRIQFSQDKMSWTTLASNVTGVVWSGPLPAAPAGFFRALQP